MNQHEIEIAWRDAEIQVKHGPLQRRDRPWSEYPLGTRAHDFMGGYWVHVERGWKWFLGDTFPTPSASAFDVSLPIEENE